MNIPENLFIVIDIIIIALFLFNIIESYRKGIVYEAVKLLLNVFSIFIAYTLGRALASSYPIVNLELGLISSFIDINSILNQIIWFIISFFILKIVMLVVLPLLKFLSEIPVIGSINKIGGIVFGMINSMIIVLLLGLLLSLPVFTNGEEVQQGTLIRYVSSFSDAIYDRILEKTDIEEKIADFNMKDFLSLMDTKSMESADDIREFIDELGVDSLEDIDFSLLSDEQKEKLTELVLKYQK